MHAPTTCTHAALFSIKAIATFDLCCTSEYVQGDGTEQSELLKILLHISFYLYECD